jgi:hypothetical protein
MGRSFESALLHSGALALFPHQSLVASTRTQWSLPPPANPHAPLRSKRAFSGLPREAVIERVSVKGARPRFPSTTPPAFAELAQACWAADPAARPSFTQIAEALDRLVGELSGRPI